MVVVVVGRGRINRPRSRLQRNGALLESHEVAMVELIQGKVAI